MGRAQRVANRARPPSAYPNLFTEITGRVTSLATSFMSHLPLAMPEKYLSNTIWGCIWERQRFRPEKRLDSGQTSRQWSEGIA